MINKKPPVICIILAVLALVLILYSVWTIKSCYDYIAAMIAQGQLIYEGNEFNVINYYVTNCSQYLLFATLFLVTAWFIRKHTIAQEAILTAISATATPRNSDSGATKDESFNEWFSKQDE